MAVNKVDVNGATVLDLTQDSVTPETLKKGETTHDASGALIVGTMETVMIPKTTALLKGDGAGGVAAATTDATPTQGSTNPVQSGGVYTTLANKLDKTGNGSNVTAAFTAASSRANIATGEKLSVLFGKIAKWFSDLGSLAFKSTVAKSDLASAVQSSLDLADTALQSLPSHNHDASAIDSGILPVIRGGTGVNSLASLATALGAARIQTGSYTGNDNYGASYPNSLTFNFAPKIVIWTNYFIDASRGYSPHGGFYQINCATLTTSYTKNQGPYQDTEYNTYAKKSSDGKTIYWYAVYAYGSGRTSSQQLNYYGYVYHWIAIG